MPNKTDKFGHNEAWNYCPGCGKKWEKDSEEFGCWSCGFTKNFSEVIKPVCDFKGTKCEFKMDDGSCDADNNCEYANGYGYI